MWYKGDLVMLKKVFVFIIVCFGISIILPLGYFVVDILFLGSDIHSAFTSSARSFIIIFIITILGLLINSKNN